MKVSRITKNTLLLLSLYCVTVTAQEDTACLSAFKSAQYTEALQVCAEEIQHSHDSGDLDQVLALYLIVADIYRYTSDTDNFEDYLDKVEQHPHFANVPDVQYKWHRLKAIRAHHLKQFEVSQNHFKAALQLAIEAKDIDRISISNSDLGVSEAALGRYKSALNYHKKNFDLLKQSDDVHRLGFTLRQIGETHLKMEEYDLAIQYLEDAMRTLNDYGTQSGADQRVFHDMQQIQQRLLDVYEQLGDAEKVAYYRAEISKHSAGHETDHEKATRLINQAETHIQNQDFALAELALTESLSLFAADGLENPQHINYLLAIVYSNTGDRIQALDYANESLLQAQNEQNTQALANVYLLLSELYKDYDPEAALSFYTRYHEQRELFLEQKYDSDLKTVQHQIELEKNQRQLMAVELDNVQQKVQIQSLTNRYLITVIPLLLLLILLAYLYHRRKREKALLLASIDYHRNQLALMSLDQQQEKIESQNGESQQGEQDQLNERLVNAMIDATTVWTRHTNQNLVELADQSGIWTITNDNGSLRVRSLEKYLSVQKMPKNPRWRNVIKTCHFVLSEPDLPLADRASLRSQLDQLLDIIKRFYGASVA